MPVDSSGSFDSFFAAATGEEAPFDYQRRLAEGDCASRLISVPTGCGKTAAVVLAWLWNRATRPDTWPRRLVYCLPMRSLVDQTSENVRQWREKLQAAGQIGSVDLQILMGGETAENWDLYPGRDAILVGTQDMLISRALNRGYGLSRYRWPMHFGLLNNDCLWVMDETQLMGVAVETSAQLEAFRQHPKLGAPTRTHTWWMSATLDPAQLATVDHPCPEEGWPTLGLEAPDLRPGSPVQTRREAVKRLAAAPLALHPGDKKYAQNLADFVRAEHKKAVHARAADQPAVLTLVVLNRVVRARETYQALQKSGFPADRLALVHSRFRPDDRQRQEEILFARDTDRIVVATQAVEAGVDVSARVLITELAPWPSLVQRFGRCNRYGEWREGTEVFWIDVRAGDKEDQRLPYELSDLDAAKKLLAPLRDVGPQTLSAIDYQAPPEVRSVIRRKDLLELFDTTADLLGHDLDISRYVRDGDDTDVQVFWREVPANDRLPDDEPDETRDEICRVSLKDMRGFFKKKPRAFVWDGFEGEWRKAGDKPRPGKTYLVANTEGGYDDRLGWTGEALSKNTVLTLRTPPKVLTPPRYDGNEQSLAFNRWVSLADHTAHVRAKLDEVLADTLPLTDVETAALRDAALWHDVGKGHEVFQDVLHRAARSDVAGEECPDPAALWAKSGGTLRPRPTRKGFRHELASALAWLQRAPDTAVERDLTAYLIAAHHGRVRLSIRSLPDEKPRPDDPDCLFARGVWNGDYLPGGDFFEIVLDGLTLSRFPLDLGYMQMGDHDVRGPSWLARMIALRNSPEFGPFRLAYLETLLRAADMRASSRENGAPSPIQTRLVDEKT